MKNSLKALLLALLITVSAVFVTACSSGQTPNTDVDGTQDGIWSNAKYTEDTEIGEGAITIKTEVIIEEKSVTITIHTDKDNLGAALIENDLVSGDESEYGLYIKSVLGIEADYDKDGTYWALSKDGEYLMTGVDSTPIADGEHYELTCTKG